ncbi:hypothetical protein A33M_3708 [Rhodovulum sp. PH10]|nr:hypothetical protein A33M_3708 [Rhodovulum sp. PH10]
MRTRTEGLRRRLVLGRNAWRAAPAVRLPDEPAAGRRRPALTERRRDGEHRLIGSGPGENAGRPGSTGRDGQARRHRGWFYRTAREPCGVRKMCRRTAGPRGKR